MAKQQSKKSASSVSRNPDRRNGKAWKKPKAPKTAPTPERAAKDELIRLARMERKEANILRRAADKEIAERLAEQSKRLDPNGVAARTKKEPNQNTREQTIRDIIANDFEDRLSAALYMSRNSPLIA